MWLLRLFRVAGGQLVVELDDVRAVVLDLDAALAGDAGQLAGARARGDDHQLGKAFGAGSVRGCRVGKGERPRATVEAALERLHRHVRPGAGSLVEGKAELGGRPAGQVTG